MGSSECILPRSGAKIVGSLQEEVCTKLPPEARCQGHMGSVSEGTWKLWKVDWSFSLITWRRQVIQVACELLKSPVWLLSCEEEENSTVLAQVAIAPLAKTAPPKSYLERSLWANSTEAHKEPMAAEHPSGQQLGKCCP